MATTKKAAQAAIAADTLVQTTAIGDALDFALIGYDKIHSSVNKVMTETTPEQVAAYHPQSIASTGLGAVAQSRHKEPTNDLEAVNETITVLKYLQDQVKNFAKNGLKNLNGPPAEAEALDKLAAKLGDDSVGAKIKDLTKSKSELSAASDAFDKGASAGLLAAASEAHAKVTGLLNAHKEAAKHTKAAADKKKSPEAVEEAKAAATAKEAEYTDGIAAMRSGSSPLAPPVIAAIDTFAAELLKVTLARGSDGTYAAWLEKLSTSGKAEGGFDLNEAPEAEEDAEADEEVEA